ncbi:hypothetical protein P9B03_15655 [Metasolibacillus meyeri]|uniref:Uncharacterized protein n=1 Tax=Metasolibacillus meyeri TaxID=1071052 RepID=A0AAW9NXJ3_9BACL|nr:hypothetical protein [Metasolibacillus meyeri]MEC1179936.1 hypothetical protein [Metasolibacillus meyeri]
MKKILIFILSITLIFTSTSPAAVMAQTAEDVQIYGDITLTTILDGNVRTAIYYDGSTTYEAIYNTESSELYIDGEKVSVETVENLERFVKGYESNLEDATVTPFYNDPGIGVEEWKFDWIDNGSINAAGLAVGAIAAGLAAIFTKGVAIPLIASTASVIASNVSSGKTTFYYTWMRWSRPHYNWPLFAKEYKHIINFYGNSAKTDFITRIEFIDI